MTMPCSITDHPAPDTGDLEIPSGIDVIRQLPRDIADMLLLEQIEEHAGDGRNHLRKISELYLRAKDRHVIMHLKCAITHLTEHNSFDKQDLTHLLKRCLEIAELHQAVGCWHQDTGASPHAIEQYREHCS